MIDARWRSVRRLLVARLDNLGDVLMCTPAFRIIKSASPEIEMTLLASPVGAQAGRLNPDISDVIVYRAPFMSPWHTLPQNSRRELQIIEVLRERHFDGAIIFNRNGDPQFIAAYLCYLADIPLRAGVADEDYGSLLTTCITSFEQISDREETHYVERGIRVVAALGYTPPASLRSPALVLSVPDRARAQVVELIATHIPGRARPLIVLHPGCTEPARTYPWEMYAKVIDGVVERVGARIVLTGMEHEKELVRQIYCYLSDEARASTICLVGVLSFPEFCALIETADLTITNNTGPMHVSAAVKTPVVALYSLSNPPEQWTPWHVPHRLLYHDVPCRNCFKSVCPYEHNCLRMVNPDAVVDAAIELLLRAAK